MGGSQNFMRALACLLAAGCAWAAGNRVVVTEYRVLFEGQRANAGGAVLTNGALELVFTGAIEDDEAGTLPFVVRTRDWGKQWTPPQRFGTELLDGLVKAPESEFVALALFGPTPKGTVLAAGYHVPRGVKKESYREDIRWRPSAALIGRREKGRSAFVYESYGTGKFLGEQFAAPGVVLADGRVVATLWGSARQGENWQCGVLLSDDDGRTWRYRRVGYAADPALRDDPRMPAGYNEQTLFEAKDGRIVSIIRGREKLGRVPGSARDTWFFHSESRDRGETWSAPQATNLAGTGASANGITLPDGSLLMACRVPYSRTLYSLPEKDLFGLHMARSFDGGKSWKTELLRQRDPQGKPFDNHYNAMNGQFVQTGEREWVYVFGQFSVKTNVHRMLMLRLRVE